MLGARVRDTITKFTGIATGVAEYVNGCRQVSITAEQLGKDGEAQQAWFDEQRVEVLEVGAWKPQPSTAKAGGPQQAPPSVPF